MYWNLKKFQYKNNENFHYRKEYGQDTSGVSDSRWKVHNFKMERLWGFQGFSPDVSYLVLGKTLTNILFFNSSIKLLYNFCSSC